jgi:hypothetical protein
VIWLRCLLVVFKRRRLASLAFSKRVGPDLFADAPPQRPGPLSVPIAGYTARPGPNIASTKYRRGVAGKTRAVGHTQKGRDQ